MTFLEVCWIGSRFFEGEKRRSSLGRLRQILAETGGDNVQGKGSKNLYRSKDIELQKVNAAAGGAETVPYWTD